MLPRISEPNRFNFRPDQMNVNSFQVFERAQPHRYGIKFDQLQPVIHGIIPRSIDATVLVHDI